MLAAVTLLVLATAPGATAAGQSIEATDRPVTRTVPQVPRDRRAAVRSSAPAPTEVRFMVAVVLPDQSVRPIPVHALDVTDTRDTTRRVSVRTALDGTGSVALAPGVYRFRSAQPVTLADSAYAWDVVLGVPAGGFGKPMELTNANATATAAGPVAPRPGARQVAPERVAFEAVKRGVFRVEAGLGHGSGFLIDVPGVDGGMVVTNAHVVQGATAASVYLDSATRVPAQVVTRDVNADLALLRLPAGRCGNCPRLPLANPAPGEPLVVAGERVLAIGFPLSQEMTLTTGVVSSVRGEAIISDVNINHGNSGGPMLTAAGQVVGVNAFGDFTAQGGPGISGAIAVSKLTPLLSRALAESQLAAPPADRTLPVAPQAAYPLAVLKAHADTVNPRDYRKLLARTAGAFDVSLVSPVLVRVSQRLSEDEVAGDRRKRERRGNVVEAERYSETSESHDWEQYVGPSAAPVVAVQITPRVGETFMSALGRGLVAASNPYVATKATMKFQGDVRGARFFRNGVEVEPIRGGHGPQAARVDNRWVELKDVADRGYYVLPPEAFAPDSDGTPSRLTVVVQDLKNPGRLSATEIEGAASARLWNDFGPYFRATAPDRPWVAADARRRSPRIPLDCEPRTGACRVVGR